MTNKELADVALEIANRKDTSPQDRRVALVARVALCTTTTPASARNVLASTEVVEPGMSHAAMDLIPRLVLEATRSDT